jgi:pyruvate/2-oxoglutarate dehydrogenase complex dihydrolipoamide acyltransferase (E2) component
MLKVFIPQAFENMEEATIGRWIKAEGQTVRESEALCELITEKTTFDLLAEDVSAGAGVLRKIVAPEKSIVPVGFCIALIGDQNEDLSEIELEAERENSALSSKLQAAHQGPEIVSLAPQAPSTPAGGSRLRATPAARRAARERGVALEEVAAAFPGKVLTEDDVAKFTA